MAADGCRAVPRSVVRLSRLACHFPRCVFRLGVLSLWHDDGFAARGGGRRHCDRGGGVSRRVADQSLVERPQNLRYAGRHRQVHGDRCRHHADQFSHRMVGQPSCPRTCRPRTCRPRICQWSCPWRCACRSDRRLDRSVDQMVARGCRRHGDPHIGNPALGQHAAAPDFQTGRSGIGHRHACGGHDRRHRGGRPDRQ